MKNVKAMLLVAALVGRAGMGIEVKSYVADEEGFVVSSHLIEGRKEAILVDAQFTRSQAKRVADLVKRSGLELKTIFITHAHPDHYFGLEILKREFPRARAVAEPAVAEEIRATAEAKIRQWKPVYGDKITDLPIFPEALRAGDLDLDGERVIQLLDLAPGEAEHDSALVIPSLRAVITGDAIMHRVHLWLAENRPESWLRNLARLEALDVTMVYPGHGEAGGRELIAEDRDYLEHYLEVTAPPATRATALAALKSLFSTYRLPVIAGLSVEARIPNAKR